MVLLRRGRPANSATSSTAISLRPKGQRSMTRFKRLTTSTSMLGDFSIGVSRIGSAKPWSLDEVIETDFMTIEDATEELAEAAWGYGSFLQPMTGMIRISGVPYPDYRTYIPTFGRQQVGYVQALDNLSLT